MRKQSQKTPLKHPRRFRLCTDKVLHGLAQFLAAGPLGSVWM